MVATSSIFSTPRYETETSARSLADAVENSQNRLREDASPVQESARVRELTDRQQIVDLAGRLAS